MKKAIKKVKDLEANVYAKRAEWRQLPQTGKGSYKRMTAGHELMILQRELDEARGELFKIKEKQ